MSVSAGTRLGPYEILERIGEGDMGEVYRARDERLQRDVALKNPVGRTPLIVELIAVPWLDAHHDDERFQDLARLKLPN